MMSSKFLRSSACLLSLMLLPLPACKREVKEAPAAQAKESTPVQVKTVPAESRDMPRFITLTGSLVADRQSNVAADVTGKVLEVLVDIGSLVRAGGVLAVLDKRSANIVSKEAEANVALARSNVDFAKSNCDRAGELLKTGALGQAEYDRTMSQCDTTKSSLAAAEARREAALKSLGDAVIRAPFAGIVSERAIDVGEYVQPQTKVANLLATDPLRLRISVPERNVAAITQGMEVQLQVSAYPKEWFKGNVRYVGASLREQTRDLMVEATVPNPDQKLRPGMFAVVHVVLPKAPVTVVPEAAVRLDGPLARVFVADKGQLQERIVELGAHDESWVEIRRGVEKGESVVSPFSVEAKDGAQVAQVAQQ
jgi:membrane fusion protein, multidrug efflux system